jgi:hypothetical protein
VGGRASCTWLWALAVLIPLVGATGGEGGQAPDRLDRFRALAATRLSLAQLLDEEETRDAYREAWALLDEEIVESLASGSVFASQAFLQERLDAFGEAWGAARLRVMRTGAFVIGEFRLGDGAGGGSVRVYGEVRGEPALVGMLARGARPGVHLLPPAGSEVQFLVAWEGQATGRGTRHLRLDLVRPRGSAIRVPWSTADLFPEGLVARWYRVRGGEIRIRYELRYPGWTPGCDGQTEREDVYRLVAAQGTYTRVARRDDNAWHRDLHGSVSRLFEALTADDRRALTALVPDRTLRERLPARLRPEPACDELEGAGPQAVSVAAVAGEDRPWALTFQRVGSRWRLVGAGPVLQ